MRPLRIGLLLLGLAACSEPTTEPTMAPPPPSFSTTSTSVTTDFEEPSFGGCGFASRTYGPLIPIPASSWQRVDGSQCDAGTTAHGGNVFLRGFDFNSVVLSLGLATPVHAMSFWVVAGTELSIDALDATGNILQTVTLPQAAAAQNWGQVTLSQPGNAIASIRFTGDISNSLILVSIDDVTLTTETGPTPSFTGFFQPVDNNGILNIAKVGSAIPVKFSLGGDFGLDVLLKVPTASAIACPTGAGDDAIEETATSPSGLSYDATTGQYTYVWKTLSGWKGTCKQLHMPLSDGIDHTALFQFK